MPVPVDSKYINPAYLPQRSSLTFPPVRSTGYVLGWGQNDVNLTITTNNRYLQELKLTTFNPSGLHCRNSHYFNTTDAPYSVNFLILFRIN